MPPLFKKKVEKQKPSSLVASLRKTLEKDLGCYLFIKFVSYLWNIVLFLNFYVIFITETEPMKERRDKKFCRFDKRQRLLSHLPLCLKHKMDFFLFSFSFLTLQCFFLFCYQFKHHLLNINLFAG